MKITEMSVEYVDHLGSDLSVVNAARVSFAKVSSEFSDSDAKLINYLAKHNHWSPFAHAFASFRIKAPIFVARQLVKHQVGLAWNEVSRRYVDEEPEMFLPSSWRSRPETSIKQGSGTQEVELKDYFPLDVMKQCLQTYQSMLHDGVAPEQARMILPQNTMTEWIWSGSLAAFCRVCNLRLDPHAQSETRELVGALSALLEPLFPVSYKALVTAHD
jgi:thymidylate synthase (FAD)